MELTLKFPGIITIAVMVNQNNGSKEFRIFIPNGTSKTRPCPNQNTDTPIHRAYIYIQTTGHVEDSGWKPNRNNEYELEAGDTISVPGITDRPGSIDLNAPEPISWHILVPGSHISDPPSKALASMTITSGTLTTEPEHPRGPFVTTGKFPAPERVTIQASGPEGKMKTLEVPGDATVGICNVRPHGVHDHDETTHFFLHYVLADKPPEVCGHIHGTGSGPSHRMAAPSAPTNPTERDLRNATIHCSNTTFP